jgi:hypothetical protein
LGSVGVVKIFYLSSNSSYNAPYVSRDIATVSEMGPTIVVRSAKAQGSKAKPDRSGQSRLEQPEQGTKRLKGWPAASKVSAPSRGPGILKLRI